MLWKGSEKVNSALRGTIFICYDVLSAHNIYPSWRESCEGPSKPVCWKNKLALNKNWKYFNYICERNSVNFSFLGHCLQFKITQIIHANHSLSVSRKNNTVRQRTADNSRSTLGANSAHKSKLTPWLSSWCSICRWLHKDLSNFKHPKSHIRSAMLFCCFDQGFRLNSSLQQAIFLHN